MPSRQAKSSVVKFFSKRAAYASQVASRSSTRLARSCLRAATLASFSSWAAFLRIIVRHPASPETASSAIFSAYSSKVSLTYLAYISTVNTSFHFVRCFLISASGWGVLDMVFCGGGGCR